jgi:hypothetical protein
MGMGTMSSSVGEMMLHVQFNRSKSGLMMFVRIMIGDGHREALLVAVISWSHSFESRYCCTQEFLQSTENTWL